jgi:hypothetical protein
MRCAARLMSTTMAALALVVSASAHRKAAKR